MGGPEIQPGDRPRYWLPLLVLALGAVSLLLAVWVEALLVRALAHDAGLRRAVGSLRAELLAAHVDLEEITGGKDLPTGRVEERLARAAEVVRELRAGSSDIRDGHEAAVTARLDELQDGIAGLATLTGERLADWREGRSAGVGTPGELAYDRRIDDLLAAADALDEDLAAHSELHRRRAELLRTLVLAAFALLVAGSAAALGLYERRRAAAERAVRDGERRLLEAQKMDAVGRLAGGVAHDVNNYLAAIRAHCELAAAKDLPRDRLVRRMELVVDTVVRASALIERLLAFGRRQPTHPESVDLNEVVEGLQGILAPAEGSTVRLDLELAADLWRVEIDLAQVEQVVANLLVNAREAAGPGGRVAIRTANRPRRRPGEADAVALEVSDDGPGVPADLRSRIFEPFFTTRAASGSSGLGLATAYSIVTAAGGEIAVDDARGGGATFRVLLPRGTAVAAAAPLAPPGGGVEGHEHLLLVDDHPDVREAARVLLQSLGYRVTLAADADEALAAARSAGPFDLVVTDVRLPGATGPELVARLRAAAGPLPAIFMSGYTDRVVLRGEGGRQEAYFVKKPFSAQGLARMVREVLDGARAAAAARAAG